MTRRPDAREIAYRVLADTDAGGFADAALGRSLARSSLGRADRDLATLLVYGTLALRGRLDHTIAAYASRPIEQVAPEVLTLLRLGAFQLLALDRVPPYAAVDTAVSMARHHAPRAGGFINALLRRIVRDGEAPLPPEASADDDRDGWIRRASVELSHPEWLVTLWLDELGAERASALMHANNEAGPTALRALVEPGLAEAELAELGIETRPGRLAPDALLADRAPSEPSAAIAQSEASQLVVVLLEPRRGERVLDACAAPGGKTAYIAELVGGGGEVTAVDPGRGAARRIADTLDRARVSADADIAPVRIVEDDIERAARELPADFDAALVDAPCSGLGTLRGHPEIRWRRTPADIDDLAERQKAILAATAAKVRPGGRLVYSTCTLTSAENEDVVRAFLADHDDWTETPPADWLGPADVLDDRGRLRTFPDRHDTDAFFATLLTRRN